MRRVGANLAFVAILLAGTVAAAVVGSGYLTTTQRTVAHANRAPAASALRASALRHSTPIRLRIPAIGVNTALQPLGLLADGTLQPPNAWQTAGWYGAGVVPGDAGPAVIAGHVDSKSGPAVFYRLDRLHAGDLAVVQRRDGRILRFVVDDVAVYPKSAFPTAGVYGPTALPMLRLVTCTGDFDSNAHTYLSNLVVSAHLDTA